MSILSIQSHVAYGHVGNAAAVLPLQRLGYDVWPVHTVMFSNHTGYGSWRGPIISASDVTAVIEGISERGVLNQCQAVLSGYMGNTELGQVIIDAVTRVRTANPKALYLCDPVMGDVGRGIFVKSDIPEFMRKYAIPIADIITPNQFELELLTNQKIETLEDALTAAKIARRLGPKVILITSLIRRETAEDSIEMLAASDKGSWLISTPRLKLIPPPNGAGDATAALFLAYYLAQNSLSKALAKAAASVFALFEATDNAGSRELALIAAQDRIVRPRTKFIPRRVS